MRFSKLIPAIIGAFILGCCASLRAQAPEYSVTRIPLGNTGCHNQAYMWVQGLNNLGQVVGYGIAYENDGGVCCFYPFIYSNGITTSLGAPLGNAGCGIDLYSATDINDNGYIVGTARVASYSSTLVQHAYMLDSLTGKVEDLGALNATVNQSYAWAINNAGQAVGNSYALPPEEVSFSTLFFNGIVSALNGTSGGATGLTQAVDINDQYGPNQIGQIVGYTYTDGAYIYSDGKITIYSSEVCPGYGAYDVTASAINNAGQIVGSCIGSHEGFLYDFENPDALVVYLPYNPADINDVGWVVGPIGNPYSALSSGPYLFINGTTYNLLELLPFDSGIVSLNPAAINNQGQIVANSNLGPVLLTPVEPK